jgi:hypothetical protein
MEIKASLTVVEREREREIKISILISRIKGCLAILILILSKETKELIS